MNFWDKLEKPFFALAPMEDVTDIVFRSVIIRAGRPDVFFTEFVNVDGFCHPDGHENVTRRLMFNENEYPIVAQIWGKNPKNFFQTAKEITKMGFSGIDINMGCPDKAVVKSGGGSALIENPELAVEIIQSVKKATDLPVSVKTRLGVRSTDEWKSWLSVLLKQNLATLTVHLRTRKEMSKTSAHFELIPEITALRDELAPETKLVINGDIKSRTHGLKFSQKNKGVDGWMIGRGVFSNPFCFESTSREHSSQELVSLLNYHLDLFDENNSKLIQMKKLKQARKFEPLKRFFKIYINNFPGAKEIREKLMETKNTSEARQIMKDYFFEF